MNIFHGFLLAPPNAEGSRLAFRLRKGCMDRDKQLTLWVDGVDILLLKDDRDAKASQLTGIVQSIHRVACES